MQWRDTIMLMGVPVDNLSVEEAVENIAQMAVQARSDGIARHVATVNVDFLVNALAWHPSGVRHPELLHILRQADMVTADGMPLVWLSRLLGAPLRQRVAGADLVPLLARLSSERGLSLYFLGGRGDAAEQAAAVLGRQYPGMKIAGIDAPFVHTQGPELVDYQDEDRQVLERINAARPDIVLIAFGNPKQEVWFDRNRSAISAGVSIGVGGTFEFITGRVSRAPVWMQQRGLEWIYRMLQDPRRLIKRYAVDFAKFGFLALFPLLHMLYARARCRRVQSCSAPARRPSSPPAGTTGAAALRLPACIDAAFTLSEDAGEWRSLLLERQVAVLDFSDVRYIDASGLGFLFAAFRMLETAGRSIVCTGIRPETRRGFAVTGTWDLFRERMCSRPPAVEDKPSPAFSWWMVSVDRTCAVLELSGTFDALQAGRLSVEDIQRAAGSRHILVNLKQLAFCDSSGIAFLLKLQRAQANRKLCLVLCNAGQTVQQMLKVTRLERVIPCAGSLAEGREQCLAPCPSAGAGIAMHGHAAGA